MQFIFIIPTVKQNTLNYEFIKYITQLLIIRLHFKEIFNAVESEELESFELDTAVAQHQKQGGKIRVKLNTDKKEVSV